MNEDNLKKNKKASFPLKIPVLIPQSMLNKSKKIQPPSIQRTLKSGEVCSFYLVSDTIPVYNPLIKAEVAINRDQLKKNNDFQAEISFQEEKR